MPHVTRTVGLEVREWTQGYGPIQWTVRLTCKRRLARRGCSLRMHCRGRPTVTDSAAPWPVAVGERRRRHMARRSRRRERPGSERTPAGGRAGRAFGSNSTQRPAAATRRADTASELEAFVDAAVRIGMDETHVAGAAVSIVQNGRIVLNKGYGFASFDPPRPVDPDTTLFRIGSITKTFTWIAVMRAVEAGKIDLDAPVNQYLPVDLQVPDDGFEQPIRVRDLDDACAGIRRSLRRHLVHLRSRTPHPLEPFLRDYRPRRVRAPGARDVVLELRHGARGRLVASVENTPWQDLIERDILSPLGLAHTSGREPYPARADLPAPMAATLARDVSRRFRWNGVAHVAREFEFITQTAPAGAMSASARDIARYMLLLLGDGTLDGVTVFGPTAARAFRTPMTSVPPGVGALDAGFFDTLSPAVFRSYGHGGATMAFFSSMVVVPELDLGIFATTNTDGGGRVSNALPARIIEHFYAPPRPVPAGPRTRARRIGAVYAGDYVSTRRRNSGLEGFLTRFANAMSVSVTSDGYLARVRRGSAHPQRYVPAGEPDVFRPAAGPDGAGGWLRFERDGNRVERVVEMPVAFERAGPFHRPMTMALAAGSALFTAAAIVVGFSLRVRRPLAESSRQRLARRAQLTAATLWLVCLATFALWITGLIGDLTGVFRDWPGPLLTTASSGALAASVSTLFCALLLPAVWHGAPGLPGWTMWRKARYTAAVAIFAAFGILLGVWGALAPWAI